MSRKLFSLVTCLVLVLNFGVVTGVAQEADPLSTTYDIYAFDPLTGTTTQITYLEDSDEYNPSWSPNGKLIAHDVLAGDQHDIYITNVKTGVSSPLVGAEGGNDAVWSPNGKLIAFDCVPIEDYSIYVVPSDGGVATLARENAISADWAPNGKRLVFQDITDGSIRTAPVDGGKGGETTIAMSGANPVWSPDGNWIAYDDAGDIWKVQVNVMGKVFSEPVQVTNGPFDDHQPTWSMDSLSIVYHSGNSENYDLWMVPAAGGKSTWLTGAIEFGDYDPAYAKNSSKIAYAGFSLDMGGAISGQIIDEFTGDPIEGGFVFACEVDVYCDSTQTDNNGFYNIALPPGTYRVGTYFETGYISEFYDDKLYWDEADDVFVIAGKETSDINFALLPAGTISGRVISEYGDGIPNLWVDACEYDTESYCASAETDGGGYYSILLPPGEYWVQVWVEQDWIGQRYDADQDGESDRVAVMVGEDTAGIDFELLAAGMISGRVTSEYGDPLAGFWVDACDFDTESYCNSAETNEDGYYSILLPPGEYWVQAFPETDWIGQRYDVDQDGEPDRVAVTVGDDTAGIDFHLLAAGMISGTVTTVDVDGNTVPVNELWVDACHESVPPEMWGNSPLCNGAQTDQNGFYNIPRLLPGNYRVVTWGNDDLSLQFYDGVLNYYESSLVTVESGQTREDVDFSLFTSGPAFHAWPVEDYVDGWGWEIDVPVTLMISDGTGTVYTATESPFYPEWNPNTTWVIFEFQEEFDLQSDYIVTLDNGIHTKQHTVTKLAITNTNYSASSVTGTAEPGSHIYVWYYFEGGQVTRHEVADSSGHWIANFSVSGDEPGEEQTFMIPSGAGGEANQVDFDGDGTQVNWWMP